MNSFGRLIAIILCMILIVITPITWLYNTTGNRIHEFINAETKQFIDKVKDKGNIDVRTYEEYANKINQYGIYQISFEHIKPVYYTDQQGETINTSGSVTYLDGSTGSINCGTTFASNGIEENQTVVLQYTGYNTVNTTKTYESPINVAVQPNKQLSNIDVNMASSTVRRYNDFPIQDIILYFADGSTSVVESGWTITDYNATTLGNQTVTVSYEYESIVKTAKVSIVVLPLVKTCEVCSNTYELDQNDIDRGCPACASKIIGISTSTTYIKLSSGEALDLIVNVQYRDGHIATVTGWTSTFDESLLGEQVVTITYEGFITHVVVFINDSITCPNCNSEYSKNEDGSDPSCPYCITTVESISISPKNITVNHGEELPIAVTATFLDGNTEEVSEWTSNYDANRIGIQSVTVYYGGAMDQITVTVVDSSDMITCPICELNFNGEENSYHCPVCFYTIEDIDAELSTGGNQIVAGTEPEFHVVVHYQDGHRELVTTGITYTGYDNSKVGIQQITVMYQGVSCIFLLELLNNLEKVTCSNEHIYYLDSNGEDPGCPFCMVGDEESESIRYFDILYTTEILETLYHTGIYELNSGEYISICVEAINTAYQGENIFIDFIGIISTRTKYTYGGRIT